MLNASVFAKKTAELILTLINFLKKSEIGSGSERKVITLSLIVMVLLAGIDQFTKMLVVHRFTLGEQKTIIDGFFHLTYVTNKGAAWGMFYGYGWALLLVSVVVMAVIIWRMRSLTEGWNERYLALFMVMSGIVGNSIDRLWRKEVVDFLDFNFGSYHWPAFNVADSAITVGVAIYICSILFRPGSEKSALPSPEEQ